MMTIFIDPKATVNAGTDYSICQTQTTFPNLNGQIGGAATSATWSGGTGTFSPNVNTLNAIYTPSPTELANPGSIVLTLTTNDPAGLCGPVSDQVTLLIDAAAFVNAGVDQTVCASNPVVQLAASFSGATTNIVWSINPPFGAFSNDVSPTSTYTFTAGDIAAGSVTLTINTNDPAGVCNSVSDMMTIFINQLSTPSVSLSVMPSSTICAGTSVTFTATPTNGGSTPQYKWFKNLIEIVGETNATLTRSDLADQDKIKVQMTSNKTCITTAVVTSFEITMTVNSLSVAPSSISGVSTVCNGDSTTLTLVGGSAGTGATAKWYSGSCGGTPQGTGNSITVAPSTSTTYFVRYEGTCNTTACASQLITVNTLSTAPTSISGTSTVCSGSSTTLTLVGGSAGTGAVAEWFTGLCGGTPAGTGNSITVSPTNNITYYVRYKGTCNTTSCASINVTVKTPSTAPLSISGVSTVCNGDSTTLTLVGGSAGTGATAKWYSGSCGGTPQGTGNSITVAPSSTSTYFVRYEGDCNTTACASQLITVNTLSVAPTSISGVSNICLGNSTTLTLAGGSAGTGAVAEWFTSSCGGTSAGTGNSIIVSPSISTTYFVRYKGTCNTTTCASVTVTITTPSVGGTVSPAQTQGCGPQTVNLSVSGINGVVTRWERQTNCNGAWASIGNAGLSAITVTTPNSSTCYRAVITNGVCPSANSTISTITVDKPAVGGRVTLQSNQMATSIALCPSQNALLIPVGFTGKVANWQYSFGTSSIWYDLPSTEGQTTLTVNGSSISGTVFYRVVIITELSICTGQSSVAYSAAFRITKKAGCTAPDGSTLNNDITTIKGLTIVKAYPNPASELISLDIENYTATPQNVVTQDALKGSAQLEILDVTGRQVLKQTISLTQGFNTINLDISQLSKGIFIVKMTDSQNQKAWVKMVKQ